MSAFGMPLILRVNGIPKFFTVEHQLDLFKIILKLWSCSIRINCIQPLVTVPIKIEFTTVFVDVVRVLDVERTVVMSGFENTIFPGTPIVPGSPQFSFCHFSISFLF
jgi:hypothetical protein